MIGVGIDLTRISRFEKLYNNQRFLNRILTNSEMEDLEAIKPELRKKFIAKKFAGKEALSKSIGEGIGGIINFKDIEIKSNSKGAPIIKCLKIDFEKINFRISFSDEKYENDLLIIAFVIAF